MAPRIVTTEADVADALSRAGAGVAFIEELQAMLGPRYEPASFADVLDRLARAGAITITSKPLPDPHLAGVDLRLVARVTGTGPDARSRAIEATEHYWNAWLSEFVASHRCS